MFFQKLALLACSISITACGTPVEEPTSEPKAVETSESSTESHSAAPRVEKVSMVEFFDFGCGHCRTAASVVGNLKKDYGDKLVVEYHHFPLSARTTRVAEASECAGKQGKFLEFHDLYFENYFGKTDDRALRSVANAVGVEDASFMMCLNSGIMKSKITQDKVLAQKYGVQGTPYFVLNQELVIPGMLPEGKFRELIDGLLTGEATQ